MDPAGPQSLLALASLADSVPIIIIIIVLVFFSAFFSGTETAFTNCSEIYIKAKCDDGSKSAKLARRVMNRYDKSLVTILIGNNVVNILMSNLATIVAIAIIINKTQASLLSTIVMTIVVFIFGELLPKNICKANANRLVLILAYPLTFFDYLLFPFSFIFEKIILLINKICKEEEDNDFDEEDLQLKVDEMEQSGELGNEESEIIQAAVDFTDTTVKDVLTPLEKVIAINIDGLPKEKLIKLGCEITYSRVPVYKKKIDNIIGVIHIRKMLKTAMTSRNFSIKSLITAPLYVEDTTLLDDMVEIFKKNNVHMAFVKDANDELLGIVTMEDILEELVGEMNKGGEQDVHHN